MVSDWFPTGFRPVANLFPHTNRVVSWSGFLLVSLLFQVSSSERMDDRFAEARAEAAGGFAVGGLVAASLAAGDPDAAAVAAAAAAAAPAAAAAAAAAVAVPSPVAASAPTQAWLSKIQRLSN